MTKAGQANAIAPTRQENFPEWYQAVVKAADLAEQAPVRGCMVIKPYGYSIWKNVQSILGQEIADRDVQDAYFPLLIPLSMIAQEAKHVDGFAKECAVVTHHRLESDSNGKLIPAGELSEPMIIRPTSEVMIGNVVSGWINSYRDLPLKLNQWCNVMRWEMRPRVFLRTAEFLWQEGHNCFATAEEATTDARQMSNMYENFLQTSMAIPGIAGRKTDDEKFPGALATYTYESMMQDGKALQMCTAHDLCQTFAKSSNIQYVGKDGQKHYAYTSSWGLTTRVIGAMLMIHGDDNGAIMPPNIAPHAVRIIPIIRREDQAEAILARAKELKDALKLKGVRAEIDARDEKIPTKMWNTIRQGVPLRVEIGERELADDTVTYVRRDDPGAGKSTLSVMAFTHEAPVILADIQRGLYQRAEARLEAGTHRMSSPGNVRDFFNNGSSGFVEIPIEMLKSPEVEKVRTDFPVTPRCLPHRSGGQTVILSAAY